MIFINNQNDSFINDSRFEIGIKLFNSCQWYKSHDVFEEIWHETGGPERQILQGILQVAVAQVHLENNNLKGAKSLLNKCKEKFLEFNHTQRGISVRGLLSEINQVNDAYERLISSKDFDWELVPKI